MLNEKEQFDARMKIRDQAIKKCKETTGHTYERFEDDGSCWCKCGDFTDEWKGIFMHYKRNPKEVKPVFTY